MTDTTYAGPEQMQWLKQQLERSNAIFKIIVHGGTIRRAGSQSWFERSKLERRELLDWIASQNIVRYYICIVLATCLSLSLLVLSLFSTCRIDWSSVSWWRYSQKLVEYTSKVSVE